MVRLLILLLYFHTSYFAIFEMDKLIYMLHMLRQVQSNKMTEKQASTVIGQKYADEYVKPLVDNFAE